MSQSSAAPPDADSIFISAKARKCRKCGRRRAVSYDRLCLACLAAERDGYKMDSKAGGELLHEAKCAISGLAGELLQSCVDPCGGHLREQGDFFYSMGLERYRALYEAAQAAKAAA